MIKVSFLHVATNLRIKTSTADYLFAECFAFVLLLKSNPVLYAIFYADAYKCWFSGELTTARQLAKQQLLSRSVGRRNTSRTAIKIFATPVCMRAIDIAIKKNVVVTRKFYYVIVKH